MSELQSWSHFSGNIQLVTKCECNTYFRGNPLFHWCFKLHHAVEQQHWWPAHTAISLHPSTPSHQGHGKATVLKAGVVSILGPVNRAGLARCCREPAQHRTYTHMDKVKASTECQALEPPLSDEGASDIQASASPPVLHCLLTLPPPLLSTLHPATGASLVSSQQEQEQQQQPAAANASLVLHGFERGLVHPRASA